MSLTIDIKRFAQMTEKKADQYVRIICLDLLTKVVEGTPVDTGRARANWQCSIGAPISGVVNFEGDAGSGVEAPAQSAASVKAIADGQSAVKQATGNIFYITNNLPYIRRLEFEGHSKQAPHGWVRAAVNIVSKAVL